ncbi:hypothetical protein LTR62_006909 [Meristemomyces frigidus]|uniref:Uncharacterized protein n=1 Tax=Meristemomyces frigidus TaxID=1508187 RepID=A0AAN7YI97_9PEZI|nr:hypothetical protein LTR62_006909 [Meristemomyces frigidus]
MCLSETIAVWRAGRRRRLNHRKASLGTAGSFVEQRSRKNSKNPGVNVQSAEMQSANDYPPNWAPRMGHMSSGRPYPLRDSEASEPGTAVVPPRYEPPRYVATSRATAASSLAVPGRKKSTGVKHNAPLARVEKSEESQKEERKGRAVLRPQSAKLDEGEVEQGDHGAADEEGRMSALQAVSSDANTSGTKTGIARPRPHRRAPSALTTPTSGCPMVMSRRSLADIRDIPDDLATHVRMPSTWPGRLVVPRTCLRKSSIGVGVDGVAGLPEIVVEDMSLDKMELRRASEGKAWDAL